MAKYAAMLRGIMPQNPNTRNEKLCGVFEGLGFTNVRAIISSGNLVFESKSGDNKGLETIIEKALSEKLKFPNPVIVRSFEQIEKLVKKNPFGKMVDDERLRLNVTFLKNPPKAKLKFPHRIEKTSFELLEMNDGAVCSVIRDETAQTVDFMKWMEKQFTKDITTRTWNTVGRIFKTLSESPK